MHIGTAYYVRQHTEIYTPAEIMIQSPNGIQFSVISCNDVLINTNVSMLKRDIGGLIVGIIDLSTLCEQENLRSTKLRVLFFGQSLDGLWFQWKDFYRCLQSLILIRWFDLLNVCECMHMLVFV